MKFQQDAPKVVGAIVFWVVWFAILQGLLIMQFFVGGGIPKGSDQGSPPVLFPAIAAGMALAVFVIRFVWIPRIKVLPGKLTAMVVGLALSEGVGLLGIFVLGKEFQATKLILMMVAFGCILSLAPVYAMSRDEDGRS